MKNELLQKYESDTNVIEKNVKLYNSDNPNDYIIEYYYNGLLDKVIILHDLEKAFFVYDSIKNSILYEIQVYEKRTTNMIL